MAQPRRDDVCYRNPETAPDRCGPLLRDACQADPDSHACTALQRFDRLLWEQAMTRGCVDPLRGHDVRPLLNKQACRKYCVDTGRCGVALEQYCADKAGRPDVEAVCGCYYAPAYYNAAYTALSQAAHLPEGLVVNNRQCWFPKCGAAVVPPNNAAECRQNIVSCVINTQFSNTGQIIGGIKIENRNACCTLKGGCPDARDDLASLSPWIVLGGIVGGALVVLLVAAIAIRMVSRPRPPG
jgi:hypothetical protein